MRAMSSSDYTPHFKLISPVCLYVVCVGCTTRHVRIHIHILHVKSVFFCFTLCCSVFFLHTSILPIHLPANLFIYTNHVPF